MRITPHSTLAISTCALALLSQLPSAHSYFGVYNKEGDNTLPRNFVQQYVEDNMGRYKLSDVCWSGGNNENLRLARVTWRKQEAFMKCDGESYEATAHDALMEAKKKLKGVLTIGRHNIMNPLLQFGFYDSDRMKYFCHLYSYINGVSLQDYFKERTVAQTFITAAIILPEVIKGSIYLYNAGIIHKDIVPKNIILKKNPASRIVGVKIIDLDEIGIIGNEPGWTYINPYDKDLLLNSNQKRDSCNKLKQAILKFLYMFIPYSFQGVPNPFPLDYKVTKEMVEGYLTKFRDSQTRSAVAEQSASYANLELGNAKAAIPAIHYLLKAYYTLRTDTFTCSSPILALKALPPRVDSA